MRFFLLISLLLPLAVFCQKKEYKRGLALEKKGEVALAMDQYKEALYKNMYFTAARDGLERCANASAGNLLSDYFIARQKGDWEKAERIFGAVETMKNEMNYFSVEINLPHYQEARFQEDQRSMKEKSRQSEALANQEETEKKARQAFDAGNYFYAYDLYDSLLAADPENEAYKNLLESAKAKGSFSVAIVNLTGRKMKYTQSLKTALLSAISRWSHPLLTIVEREDLDVLIEEQKRAFTGLFDESTTAVPGALKGVKHLFLMQLEDIHYKSTTGETIRQTAYEKERFRVYDEAGNWRVNERYLPRYYLEKSGRTYMTAALHYKLVAVETGEVLMAGKVKGKVEDKLVFSVYEGNAQTLFPVRQGEVVISGEYLQQFRDSFGEKRPLKDENELFHELQQQLATETMAQVKASFMGGRL